MAIYHTYTPVALRGRGIADALVSIAFTWADANAMTVVPECTYVSECFLPRHPEWRRAATTANGR